MALTCWGAGLGRRLCGWIGDHRTAVQAEVVRQTTDQKWQVGERKERNRFQECKLMTKMRFL